MINFYRSAGIASGKTVSAMAFAREVAAFSKQATGVALRVALPIR